MVSHLPMATENALKLPIYWACTECLPTYVSALNKNLLTIFLKAKDVEGFMTRIIANEICF